MTIGLRATGKPMLDVDRGHGNAAYLPVEPAGGPPPRLHRQTRAGVTAPAWSMRRATPCPPGTMGRLAVRGPTGCRYLSDARQASYVQNGWNITGDTFVMDDDGYFHFAARNDDIILSAGYNIAGPEVEAALLAHAAVAECAVIKRTGPGARRAGRGACGAGRRP